MGGVHWIHWILMGAKGEQVGFKRLRHRGFLICSGGVGNTWSQLNQSRKDFRKGSESNVWCNG